uniref:Zinc finger protein 287-like n=1 Tax=Kryptolebias marmoratus TaxID=37003 RepID=A0A3Q3A3A0_KRYMA
MESGSSAAPGNMSKTDILRGIITEKLSTAAREILAVVERTVADYEEEASAFRQEIDRQRRQLELLQPPYCIKVEPTDPDEQSLFSVCGAGGWDVLSKEEQHRYEIGSGNSWNLENLKDPTEKEVRKDGEENPTQEQEYGTVSRFSPPAVQTDPVNVGRPAVKDLENLVNLRICILRDWDIQVLSNVVFKKYPFHELECPCGLQEDEFLNLLRSIFPPLASDKPFDFFITDRTKKLYPLKVESFTPEQVSKAVGNSALYIRLKRPAELQAGHEEPRQDFRKKDEEDNDPSVRAAPSTRNETSQKKHPQHRMAFKDNPVNLRIHILEESGVDVVLPQALNKSPPHELRCPCGLKEADFLDLLTSTFPQLAGGRPFTVLAEEGGELHPVKVESVTPEEIRRSSRSTGSPVIYIQLKKELPPPKDAAPENPPSSSHPSCPNTRPQSAEADRPVELKVCILDDPNIDVITASVFQKAAVVDLRCPAGLQEANFLDFFTSNFPVLEGKAFDLLARHGNKLRPLNVKNPTPEKIQLSVSSFSEAVLYVRLKEQQDEARKARSDVSDPTKASTSKHGRRRKRRRHRHKKTEDSEDDDDHKNKLSTPQPQKPENRSQMKEDKQVKHSDLGTNSKLDEDETEDSEDGDYHKPEPSRLWFMPFLTSQSNTKENGNTGPEEVMEEQHVQHSVVDTNSQLEDEETEDSEDGEDHSNPVSTKLLSPQPRKSDLRLKQSRNPEPGKTTKKQKVKQNADRQTEDGDTMNADDGRYSNPRFPSLLESDGNRNTKCVEQMVNTNSQLEEEEAENKEGSRDRNAESAWLPPLQPGGNENRNPEQHVRQSDVSENTQSPQLPQLPQADSCSLLPCKVCSSLRGSESMLIKHAWTHVDDRGMLCGVCGERSESTKELRRHLQSHQKTHNCDICGKSFLTVSGFRGHMNRHKGNTPHECKTCHKAFTEKSALKKHVMLHVRDEKHDCNTCHKSFSSEGTLKLHLLTHSGRNQQEPPALRPARTPAKERLMSCEICNSLFFTRKGLQRHMTKHSSKMSHS